MRTRWPGRAGTGTVRSSPSDVNAPHRPGPPGDPADADGDATRPVDTVDLDEPLSSETLPDAVACPFCESTDTGQFAVFGGQASTSQYYCNGCRTVFEFLKWR